MYSPIFSLLVLSLIFNEAKMNDFYRFGTISLPQTGAYIFSSSSTNFTIWTKSSQQTLQACFYQENQPQCFLSGIRTIRLASQIKSIKEKYNPANGMTTYLIAGKDLGHICVADQDYNFNCQYMAPYALTIQSTVSCFAGQDNIVYTAVNDQDMTVTFYKFTIDGQTISHQPVMYGFSGGFAFQMQQKNSYFFVLMEIVTNSSFSLITFQSGPGGAEQVSRAFITNEPFKRINMKLIGEDLYVVTATKIVHFSLQQNIPVFSSVTNSVQEFSQFQIFGNSLFMVKTDGFVEYLLPSYEVFKVDPFSPIQISNVFVKLLGDSQIILVGELEQIEVKMYKIGPDPQEPEQPITIDESLSNYEKVCAVMSSETCISFCNNHCSECNGNPSNCSSCKSLYYLKQNNECQFSILSQIITIVVNLLFIMRPQSAQSALFFLGNLELYNYHRTQYSGFFYTVISFMDTIQQNIWTLFPSTIFKNWIQQPIELPTYLPYTNLKFQQIQRRDSLFLQNTKQFMLIYVPFNIVLFFIFNRVFYILFNHKASQFLRLYSFYFYLLQTIVIQNSQFLLVYSINHLKNMFTFSVDMKAVQIFSLLGIGFIFITLNLFFPMILYFYLDQSKHFLCNVRLCRWSIYWMMIKFVIKPIIEAGLHVCLYEDSGIQKLFLSALQLLLLIVFLGIFVNEKIFILYGVFWFDLFSSFSVSVLNILLYIRYEMSYQQTIIQTVDLCITNIVCLSFVSILINAFYPLIEFIISKIKSGTIKKQGTFVKARIGSNLVKTKEEFKIKIIHKMRKKSQR